MLGNLMEKERYTTVGISLTPTFKDKIDSARGDEGRSSYIRRAIKAFMEEGGE